MSKSWLLLLQLQGSAVKAGMMIGRGQHLLMADADGATRTSDLARLEDALKQLNDPGSAHNLFRFF